MVKEINWNTVLVVLVIGVVGILLLSNSGILTGALSTRPSAPVVKANSCDADTNCEVKGLQVSFPSSPTQPSTVAYACFDNNNNLIKSFKPCIVETSKCYETDNSKDFYKKGQTCNNKEDCKSDVCHILRKGYLDEYYCSEKDIRVDEIYKCPSGGCKDGACLRL